MHRFQMAAGHSPGADLEIGGASCCAAAPNEGGPLRAGWTWRSFFVSLQGGASERGKFPEGYRTVPTLVMHALPKDLPRKPAVQMVLPMAEMVGWLRQGVGTLIRQAG